MYLSEIDPELVEKGRLLMEQCLRSIDTLYHYGVKGMKWGVRRTPEQLGHDRGSITSTVNRYLRSAEIKTRDGVRVTGISIHAAEQAENRKVSKKDILDATERSLYISPVTVDPKGRPSKQYLGKDATVAINPNNGNIVSVWPTSTKRAGKHMANMGRK